MKQESGRSLIEVVGVLAVAGLMTVSVLGLYNMIRKNQVRTFADTTLEEIARNTKMLMEMRGSYEGVSVQYLKDNDALESVRAPIGGDDWSVVSSADGKSFSITLVDLTTADCNYFAASNPKWASAILVNGFETGLSDNCFNTDTNQISFIVE